jgi:hypothetical protein
VAANVKGSNSWLAEQRIRWVGADCAIGVREGNVIDLPLPEHAEQGGKARLHALWNAVVKLLGIVLQPSRRLAS